MDYFIRINQPIDQSIDWLLLLFRRTVVMDSPCNYKSSVTIQSIKQIVCSNANPSRHPILFGCQVADNVCVVQVEVCCKGFSFLCVGVFFFL